MALMHESRYRVEKAWREFMTTYRWSWTGLDAAAFEHGYDIVSAETR